MNDGTKVKALETARRQLHQVLARLALLDVSVLIAIVALAVTASWWHASNFQLLSLILIAAGTVIGARMVMAVHLRRGVTPRKPPSGFAP
ncbi:MAG TPA: hypothetical protein VJS68_03860 [Thermoplasmata archaeon]|nr:hypothetical protein [Thermoplasmata archaeon]